MRISNYLGLLLEGYEGNRICLDNQEEFFKNRNIGEIAKMMGVSERLVYYWLKGERPVPVDKLRIITDLEKSYENANYFYINGVKQKTKLPKNLTLKLSYLIGYIFGDGHIGKNDYGFSLSDASEKNIILAQKLLKKIFNLSVNYRFREDRNYYEISVSWKTGVLILNKVFEMPRGSKNGKLKIPQVIRNSSFINQVMFTLGFAAADFGGNSLTQTSYHILLEIQQILLRLNLPTKIYGPYGPYEGNEVVKWIMSFNKLESENLNLMINSMVDKFS